MRRSAFPCPWTIWKTVLIVWKRTRWMQPEMRANSDSSTFQVTRREAAVEMIHPEVGFAVRGRTTVEGSARDENGIAEVWVSFDNGNSYFRADGKNGFQS